MKTYFTRYLPGEDNYKVGDSIRLGLNIEILRDIEDVKMAEKFKYQKVQLFLCTEKIEIGDKVIDRSGREYIASIHDMDEVGIYKVIGPISPEATWVKEEDTFNLKELAYLVQGDYCPEEITYHTVEFRENKPKPGGTTIAIKGPCGHFH